MVFAALVGAGLHRFRNYSNTNYGPITLREALGNSLNIPAILTINYVGVDHFLSSLHDLGFESLTRDASIYDEGLALGNGEVTLYELTRAYAALANRGNTRRLQFLMIFKSGSGAFGASVSIIGLPQSSSGQVSSTSTKRVSQALVWCPSSTR